MRELEKDIYKNVETVRSGNLSEMFKLAASVKQRKPTVITLEKSDAAPLLGGFSQYSHRGVGGLEQQYDSVLKGG